MTKLEDLRKKVETAQKQSDQAKGRLDAIAERLKEEHGCKSFAAAKKKLKELSDRREAAVSTFETALEEFENEHADTLEKMEEANGNGGGPGGRVKRKI